MIYVLQNGLAVSLDSIIYITEPEAYLFYCMYSIGFPEREYIVKRYGLSYSAQQKNFKKMTGDRKKLVKAWDSYKHRPLRLAPYGDRVVD